jgi:hypothetical protein
MRHGLDDMAAQPLTEFHHALLMTRGAKIDSPLRWLLQGTVILKTESTCVKVQIKSVYRHIWRWSIHLFRGNQEMTNLNITESELENLIKKAIISTLTERSDLLENAVAEAILDIKLGLAIEEGDTGEYVDEKQISSLLKD